MPYEFYFLKGLALTVSVELLGAILIRLLDGNFIFWKTIGNVRWAKFISGVIMASIMTLPYVWFVLPLIQPRPLYIVVAEFFAWLLEAFFYKHFFNCRSLQALTFSLVLNLFSFGAGLLIFPFL